MPSLAQAPSTTKPKPPQPQPAAAAAASAEQQQQELRQEQEGRECAEREQRAREKEEEEEERMGPAAKRAKLRGLAQAGKAEARQESGYVSGVLCGSSSCFSAQLIVVGWLLSVLCAGGHVGLVWGLLCHWLVWGLLCHWLVSCKPQSPSAPTLQTGMWMSRGLRRQWGRCPARPTISLQCVGPHACSPLCCADGEEEEERRVGEAMRPLPGMPHRVVHWVRPPEIEAAREGLPVVGMEQVRCPCCKWGMFVGVGVRVRVCIVVQVHVCMHARVSACMHVCVRPKSFGPPRFTILVKPASGAEPPLPLTSPSFCLAFPLPSLLPSPCR